ncbi:MAG: lytic murein transglycosylase [Elusimicrobia bacterium]|nr:lytic murein transglycosylase [Elusimicrobiota bacterium]
MAAILSGPGPAGAALPAASGLDRVPPSYGVSALPEPTPQESAADEAAWRVSRLRLAAARDAGLDEGARAEARRLQRSSYALLDARDRAFLDAAASLRLGGFTVSGMGIAAQVPSLPGPERLGPVFLLAQDFQAWLAGVRQEALTLGVPAATLDDALAGLVVMEDVLKLEDSQPEHTITFEEYLVRVVSDARVERGKAEMASHAAQLDGVSAKYGVPSATIAALWGIESNYGRSMGAFPVIGALATLAYAGKRPSFFRKELLEALRILAEEGMPSKRLLGSWAGAMGQCQFMPSTFRKLAVDGDGDGKRDIWKNETDVFASAANYLSLAGWRKAERWGQAVTLPPAFDQALADLKVVKPVAAWKALGVEPRQGEAFPDGAAAASVIRPTGPGGRAFLVGGNFRVFMSWNRSTYFAAAAGLLSDRLAR